MQQDKIEDFIMNWEIGNNKVSMTNDSLTIDGITLKFNEITKMRENKNSIVIYTNIPNKFMKK